MEGFESLLHQWITAQPGVTEVVDTLVCDGKTLRDAIAENATGAARFIVQVSLYSNSQDHSQSATTACERALE